MPARPGNARRFLYGFYALALVWGVRGLWHALPSALDLLAPVYVAGCLCGWALEDARTRRRPIPLLSRGWFLLLPHLAIPGYVVLSRGWRGAGLLLLHAVLWLALATFALHVCGLVA